MTTMARSSDAAGQPRPGWLFLLSSRWLCWHAFTVVAFFGMLWLGDWQLHRAEGGNELSWAYTFEWPLFAIFVVIFWARTLRDELRRRGRGTQAGPAADGRADPGPLTPAGQHPDGAALADGQSAADDTDEADTDEADTDEADADEAARAAHLELLMAEVRRHRQGRGWR